MSINKKDPVVTPNNERMCLQFSQNLSYFGWVEAYWTHWGKIGVETMLWG